MEIIDKEKFQLAKKLDPSPDAEIEILPPSKEELEPLINGLSSPVESQKEMAVRIKLFLDKRMEKELIEFKSLSDNTRKWVETYNNLLEKIQKAVYGDKIHNTHEVRVSHAHIAAKMRRAEEEE